MLLIALSTTSYAANPNPPTIVTAEVVPFSGRNGASILVLWRAPLTGPAPTGYTVYIARPSSNDTLGLEIVGKSTATEIHLPLPASGPYAFYVSAFNNDGESGLSEAAEWRSWHDRLQEEHTRN